MKMEDDKMKIMRWMRGMEMMKNDKMNSEMMVRMNESEMDTRHGNGR